METTDIETLFLRFEQLNEIGAALSRERDLHRLLEKILLAAKAITHADGGTLYLLAADGQPLPPTRVRPSMCQTPMPPRVLIFLAPAPLTSARATARSRF